MSYIYYMAIIFGSLVFLGCTLVLYCVIQLSGVISDEEEKQYKLDGIGTVNGRDQNA